jgi:predicted nuclease with TOPRIM domain
LINGTHFSDVIDVMARRGAYIDLDHILVIIKLRARICRAGATKLQQLRRFVVDKLKDRDELESELQGMQAQPLSLDGKCKKLEETIQRVATNTIGYTRKQANKERFDGECAKVNKRASHPNQNQRSQESLQTSPGKRKALVQKKVKAAR